jgi:hypothetical protein
MRKKLRSAPNSPDALERLNYVTGRGAANILLGLRKQTGLPLNQRQSWRTPTLALYSFLGNGLSIGLLSIVALLTQSPFVFPSLGPTGFLLFSVTSSSTQCHCWQCHCSSRRLPQLGPHRFNGNWLGSNDWLYLASRDCSGALHRSDLWALGSTPRSTSSCRSNYLDCLAWLDYHALKARHCARIHCPAGSAGNSHQSPGWHPISLVESLTPSW